MMEPEGLVDVQEPLDLRTILDRYSRELSESNEPEDEVIARYLARYGPNRGRPAAGGLLDSLDIALEKVPPGAGRILLALIRHLARRGLVDTEELLAELVDE